MIPRFANPHAVFERTQPVSRQVLYTQQREADYPRPDLSLLDEFNSVMKRTIPSFNVEEAVKKRRKVETNNEEDGDTKKGPILFRLISSGPPVIISLEPDSQKIVKVKEPEIEDNKAQAKERRERALSVAVDADWVARESLKQSRHPLTQSPILHITLPSPSTPTSPIMVLYHNKPVRKTRPPVRSKLGYPYNASAKPEFPENPVHGYPIFDLNRVLDNTGPGKHKRRRRKKVNKIEHKFWRSDPNVKGKCMGYAMGYTRRWRWKREL